MDFDPAELARYSRHLVLPGVGREGQVRLKSARILIVGMGGLGSPAAFYLAAAGVGTLGLADFDTVATHNLQRQILHDTPSVDQPKIDSARRRLNALNPHVELVEHRDGVTLEGALEIFRQYDLVIDGSDNFATRYLNNDVAKLAGKPLVYGSIFQFEGQVSVFAPHLGGPCYRCLFPRPPGPGEIPNCDEAGVFGALCGTVGSIQAMQALNLILGIGEPMIGRMLRIDGAAMRFTEIKLARDPDCPLCGTHPTITKIESRRYEPAACTVPGASSSDFASAEASELSKAGEVGLTSPAGRNAQPAQAGTRTRAAYPAELPFEISASQAAPWLASEDPPLLVDVREPYEIEICSIPESRNIPMGQIPAAAEALPRDRPLLVLCHHGMRSAQVVQFLRQKGFARTSNLAGGIDAWAREVDPTMHRY